MNSLKLLEMNERISICESVLSMIGYAITKNELDDNYKRKLGITRELREIINLVQDEMKLIRSEYHN